MAVSVRPAAFAFIFLTVLLDMMALGMVIPVLPKLVENFLGGDTSRAAEMVGVFGTAWALMQFLFSPIQGALSDRFGRRPVLLASNFGQGLDFVLMALAPGLFLLFVGRLLSGIFAATISTSFAYIADITEPERRAARFGLIGAAFGAGFVIGPALGGFLATIDPRAPFWAAAAASLINGCYGLLVVPESLPADRRAPFSWAKANPIGSINLLRSNAHLFGLAVANFLGQVAHVALSTTFVLYVGFRYGWDDFAVGLALTVVGALAILVQGVLISRLVKWMGERRALLVGLLFGALSFAIYGLAPNSWVFWIGIVLGSLWGLAGPTTNSLMSRYVAADEQGRLQGATMSAQGIANMVGPVIFAVVFANAIRVSPAAAGAPFFIAAGLMVVSIAIAWRATREDGGSGKASAVAGQE